MLWPDLLDVIQKAATILAFLVGGVWVYFSAFRARTFVPRVATQVEARLRRGRHRNFIGVTCQITNVSVRTIAIDRESTVITITPLSLKGPAKFIRSGKLEPARTFPIVQRHEFLEPGSVVQDAALLFLPEDFPEAIRVDLVVGTNNHRWSAATIVVDEKGAGHDDE
jgi:hypothetical protein